MCKRCQNKINKYLVFIIIVASMLACGDSEDNDNNSAERVDATPMCIAFCD